MTDLHDEKDAARDDVTQQRVLKHRALQNRRHRHRIVRNRRREYDTRARGTTADTVVVVA
jgi:hypothetical protein